MRTITLTIPACLLVLVLMLIVFSISPVYSQAAGGTGTELDPFVIVDCDGLQDMQSDLGAYYKLGNDIVCSMTSTWPGGAGFEPVGDGSNRFAGSFDGDGRTIIGLFINRPSTDDIGLFGHTDSSSMIKDVGLEGIDVSGLSVVGGLVGRNRGSISDSYATGSVTATSGFVGGLVGSNSRGSILGSHAGAIVTGTERNAGGLAGGNSGSISDSYATGSVNGDTNVGGLAGVNIGELGQISGSYATGSVTGGSRVGGLVGYNDNDGAFVTNSYATGSVNGNDKVGGLVGESESDDFISNSYSIGSVTGNTMNTGGLVGFINTGSGDEVTSSYWDILTSGQATSAGGTGQTTAQMMQQVSFVDWDFTTIWSICEGESYPWLRWQNIQCAPENAPPSADAGADVTVGCTDVAGMLVTRDITLDGSGSSDPDSDPLTYEWTVLFPDGGETVVTGVNPVVTFPLGTSTITLVVNDGQADSAASDTVDVTVTVGVNGLLPPLAGLTLYPAAVPLPTKAFKVGRTLPLRFQLSCGSISLTDANVLPPTIEGFVQWVGDDMHMEFADFDDSGLSNDNGFDFRFSDGNWVYNLSTKTGVAGVYFVTIEMPDGQLYRGGFTLRE